ncbi:hypothetical protein EEL31_18070 [Brevibacillus laterosporus]|nr:hypothetical protein [Brevibacillus laterosporus]TPG70206.1 hypothetical protein EEL31_18070 [Brevibacillus laterosporus]
MRALVVKQFDTQPILEIEEHQDVTPKTGEAVVRIHRAALNPLETPEFRDSDSYLHIEIIRICRNIISFCFGEKK